MAAVYKLSEEQGKVGREGSHSFSLLALKWKHTELKQSCSFFFLLLFERRWKKTILHPQKCHTVLIIKVLDGQTKCNSAVKCGFVDVPE